VELLIYAPLRYAIRNGCRRLILGPDSPEPKTQRGATLEAIWTLA
jgi:hypothetical protein